MSDTDKVNTFKKVMAACGLSGAIAASSLLLPFEGTVNKTYLDPVKILTSCTGHTGKELILGQTFTDEQCTDQLIKDIQVHDRQLMSLVRVPINDYEHAAYLSFVFNKCVGNLAKSTMLGKLNAGNHAGACEELLRWVYADGKKLKGLERRAQAERAMCVGKIIPDKNLLEGLNNDRY